MVTIWWERRNPRGTGETKRCVLRRPHVGGCPLGVPAGVPVGIHVGVSPAHVREPRELELRLLHVPLEVELRLPRHGEGAGRNE
jgi:hypothetical protein